MVSPKSYNRTTLYEQIWRRPVRDVAKDYGISDVALAKICRKLNVPRPPVGYWARKEAGYEDPIPPLLKLKPGEPEEYVVERTDRRPGYAARIEEEAPEEPNIVVPEELVKPHPLVKQSRGRVGREARKAKLPESASDNCLDIRVTKATFQRGLRVADTLLKAFDERELAVEITAPNTKKEDYWSNSRTTKIPSRTRVLIGDDWVEFGIDEDYDSIAIEQPTQRYSSGYEYTPPPERKRVPNGKLALRIRNAPWSKGLRTMWKDGKVQRVERCLNDFIRGLDAAAAGLREQRLKRERWQREREEAELRRAEDAERQRAETALLEDLDRRVNDRYRARLIREIVDTMNKEGAVQDPEMRQWITWASTRADALHRDVLNRPPPPLPRKP